MTRNGTVCYYGFTISREALLKHFKVTDPEEVLTLGGCSLNEIPSEFVKEFPDDIRLFSIPHDMCKWFDYDTVDVYDKKQDRNTDKWELYCIGTFIHGMSTDDACMSMQEIVEYFRQMSNHAHDQCMLMDNLIEVFRTIVNDKELSFCTRVLHDDCECCS